MKYADRITHALNCNDLEAVTQVVKESFEDKQADENELAWIAGTVFESRVQQAYGVLQLFTDRFPESFHPIRVFWADLLCERRRYDEASDLARSYLRQVADHSGGLQECFIKSAIISHGVERALLMVTAIYTELGARSYSTRAMQFALQFPLKQREIIVGEIDRLQEELQDPSLKKSDEIWEQFFQNGSHLDTISQLCKEKQAPRLAKRIDLLETHLRFDANFRLDIAELLQLVCKTPEGTYILA